MIGFRSKKLPDNHVVAVLGMHRSGTSSLAGCLEDAGVFLGEVAPSNRNNPKGNRENRKIISLHKDLLKSNGGSWDDPPETVLWKKKHKKTRDRIIREFAQHPVWGFKDPRALLALDGWLEALPNLKCVGIFRNPFLVAQSLQRRNEFPLEKALALWLSYNRQLVHHHNRLDFPIVSFDEEADRYIEKVRELTTALDIGLDASRIAFFSPELRHVDIETDDELPEACAALYADLQARAM
ncbi:MAG TPA: sulfotransferase family protein [Thiolapillus brandeum]|uniref:Sulfotransferase family protein n=1 Tax=Thiolapillus brandeum TaxID=1076588 RepID=A0A831W8W8_9GAMM|nr:sulfotransferase family protein [Thiolapillus brandeum]